MGEGQKWKYSGHCFQFPFFLPRPFGHTQKLGLVGYGEGKPNRLVVVEEHRNGEKGQKKANSIQID